MTNIIGFNDLIIEINEEIKGFDDDVVEVKDILNTDNEKKVNKPLEK